MYSSFDRPRCTMPGGGVCWGEVYSRSMVCRGEAFWMYCCRDDGGVDNPLYLEPTGDWFGDW